MTGNCHLLFGTAVGAAVCMGLKADPAECVTIMSTCIIGSVFPDIDNPTSHVGGLTVPFSTVIGKISEAFGKTGARHRGIFHDLLVYLVGLYFAFRYFNPVFGFFIGALSHLFLDMFNPSGVPFLFGLLKVRLARVVSGSTAGTILSVLLSVMAVGTGAYLLLK